MRPRDVASRIQHTNVRPDATDADIARLVDECLEYRFDGAMVAPIWVPFVADRLSGSPVKVCTAFDYPMGGGTTESVAAEVRAAITAGAQQVDVMTKVGWLRSGRHDDYRDHLGAIVAAADGHVVKAMLEVALLEEDEVAAAVELCVQAGVAYVKNSSGYGGGNAEPALITRLARLAAGRIRVKASGGIKTFWAAEALIAAGADLLGASGSVAIMGGSSAGSGY